MDLAKSTDHFFLPHEQCRRITYLLEQVNENQGGLSVLHKALNGVGGENVSVKLFLNGCRCDEYDVFGCGSQKAC